MAVTTEREIYIELALLVLYSLCTAEVVRQAALLRELCDPQQGGAQQVERGSEGPHAAASVQARSASQRVIDCDMSECLYC